MTEREFRLRRRVDELRDERDDAVAERTKLRKIVASFVGASPKRPYRECVYCGAFTYGKACPGHRDLIQLDPNMGSLAA